MIAVIKMIWWSIFL